MPSPIALLVQKRFRLVTFFLLLALLAGGWFFLVLLAFVPSTISNLFLENRILFWATAAAMLFHLAAIIFSFTLAMAWNLQFKISFRFRPGALIKWIFWLSGVFTIHSGIIAYIFLIENKDFGLWPLAVFFAGDFFALLISMSVRYAIDEDTKKRKICEFC